MLSDGLLQMLGGRLCVYTYVYIYICILNICKGISAVYAVPLG